jgi:hypothetical protein
METSPLAMALDSLKMRWLRYVIGFSRYDQITMLSSLTVPMFETPDISGLRFSVSPIYIIGIALAIGAVAIIAQRGSPSGKRLTYSTKAYIAFRNELKKRGGRIYDSSTPEEVADEALRLKADPQKVSAITLLYLADRFGDVGLSKEDRDLLVSLPKGMFR